MGVRLSSFLFSSSLSPPRHVPPTIHLIHKYSFSRCTAAATSAIQCYEHYARRSAISRLLLIERARQLKVVVAKEQEEEEKCSTHFNIIDSHLNNNNDDIWIFKLKI